MNREEAAAVMAANTDRTCAEIRRFVRQPSVVTNGSEISSCAELVRDYLREFGCSDAALEPTGGNPLVFANYRANASKTLIVFLWYDTADAPRHPSEGEVVDSAPFGSCLIGRGAFTKGSLVAFVEAMKSLREARGELPVNLKFVIEGEENMGSRNLPTFVEQNVERLRDADGVLFPRVAQDPQEQVPLSLGSKGMIRFDLVCSGGRWGRGPQERDCHSAEAAWVDNPLWRLVHALNTLKTEGKILIEGFYDDILPPTREEEEMLAELAKTFDIQEYVERIGVKPYDMPPRELLRTYLFSPTLTVASIPGARGINIPARASARMEIRYLPNQSVQGLVEKMRRHLDSHGYPDVDIEVSSVIDCAKVPISDPLVQSVIRAYGAFGVKPQIWPNSVRSSPWNVFNRRLGLPMAQGGLGHAGRLHEPDEYFVIEPRPPYFGLVDCQTSYALIVNDFARVKSAS